MSRRPYAVPYLQVPMSDAPSPALPGYPQSPMMQRAHALWLQARGDREMPALDTLARLTPPEMVPFTILFDVLNDPQDFRYADIGARIRAISNSDNTGRLMSDLPHQQPPSKVWDHLSSAVEARAPVRAALPYVGRSRDFSSIYHIVLPLAEDGETTDRLLVFVDLGSTQRSEDDSRFLNPLG